jgi:hypothetical protein
MALDWVEICRRRNDLAFPPAQDEVPSLEPVLVLVTDQVEATIAALHLKSVAIITEPQAAPAATGTQDR